MFPDPSVAKYDDSTKTVTVTLDFWIELAAYKAMIDKNKTILGVK